MKKIGLMLLALPLMLCGCSTQTPTYETHIYCSYDTTCRNCEKWTSDIGYSSAYSITCTDLTRDSYHPHYHYCVTFVHY